MGSFTYDDRFLGTLVCQIDVHARLLILGVKVQPKFMSLFGPTGLLILEKISHLHVYSNPTGLLILRNFSNLHVYSALKDYYF